MNTVFLSGPAAQMNFIFCSKSCPLASSAEDLEAQMAKVKACAPYSLQPVAFPPQQTYPKRKRENRNEDSP